MTAPTQAAYLTPAEAAAELGCGIDTIHRAIRRHDLQAFKYGRVVRIARSSWEAFLAARQQGPAQARTRRTA